MALYVALALVAIAMSPDAAWAWTPGTHVFLGEAVMRSLPLLPATMAELLQAFPFDFLYGSIAADTSIAKKYAPAGRHCHSWDVGLDVLDASRRDEPLRAFALGYLSHLAADSVAHNYFVPHQLALTSSTSGLGHSYWESRYEMHLGGDAARRARELILLDHSRADALLDRVLSPTIFSTSTNRRIFRGMVVAADSESWQRIFTLMLERSRWDLADDDVASYLRRSYDFVMDFLLRLDRSEPFRLDPSGEERLAYAKRLRRQALREGGEELLRKRASSEFGMPDSSLAFSAHFESFGRPLYEPNRAASS
jgi:hypothetical protein